ncbi:B3 domain-containing protein Os01g0723500-like isoform X2 [Humulus lupulus]|uniref:B3 domain-containing protein Os01g0723500-like isoform X2 n=1 Tax=Humulus lupulus TaxID=3486 RepID=UPI002B4135C4|nr:B3 domain-containing protein Os01g0723500-like isoform X2 [Humulus lupulus]
MVSMETESTSVPSGKRPHFFAFYSAHLSAEQLETLLCLVSILVEYLLHCWRVTHCNLSQKIPTKFMKHMEGRSSGSVALEGPSGKTWLINLIQSNGDLFLHHGWPTFVKDNYVECGDFLIFRYDSELHFTVQIFDQSACEKEVAFHSKCSQDFHDQNLGKKRIREDGISSSDRIVEGVLKKMREDSPEHYSDRIHSNQEAVLDLCRKNGCHYECVTRPCEHTNYSKETQQYGSLSKKCDEKPALDIVLFKAKAMQSLCSKADRFNVNGGGCVQMSAAHEVVQSFTSCYPYFVRIMKSFNVSGSFTLNIPYQFSMAHLPNCKVKIVLQNLNGQCWTVNSVPSTRVHTSHTLCGGWMAFVRYNAIKIGDICIFELVGECEFRVHILGVGNEEVDCQSGKVASSWPNTGNAVTSHKSIKGFSKKMRGNSSKAHSKSLKLVDVSDKKVSKKLTEVPFANDVKKHGNTSKALTKVALCSQSNAANKKLVVHRSRGVEDELGSQPRSGPRMLLALDEERAARSFSSCFPNFVKIMKKFNISGSYTLKIPHQFSTAHLPNYKTEILLRNLNGECWTVNSVPDSQGRLVHTFCGGWMAFVRGNGVKIGDICIFELVGKCEMRVHISEVGKRGLDHQVGEATSDNLALISSTSEHLSL